MLLNTDLYPPQELTGYARAALADQQQNRFTLARWLPNRPIEDLIFRFNRGGDGLTEAATYRAWSAESPIGKREGRTRVTGELAPVSEKVPIDEYELARAQERDDDGAVERLIEDATTGRVRAIAARLELARGQALVTGALTLNENGLVGVGADFGRAAGHTVAAATAWSTVATATPLADMLAWQTVYTDTNGEPPGASVMSTTVLGYLLRNAEIRALLGTTLGTPARVSRAALDGVMEAYGLPPIYIVDTRVNVSGAATRVIAEDKFLFLPAPVDPDDDTGTQLGATLLGPTPESRLTSFALAADEQAGIVAGAYDVQDPVSVWVKAAAVGIPVLANPNLSFAADVA